MAARINNRHQQMVRDKIQATQLIKRLQDHANSKIDLKASQVDAAKYLISQAIGSAAQFVEHSGAVRHITELADAELEHIAVSGRDRASEETSSPKVSPGIH